MESRENIESSDPNGRVVLKGRTFSDTTYHHWRFAGVEFNQCVFSNILSNCRSPSFFWCPVFRHTIFRGKIAKLKLNFERFIPSSEADRQSNTRWLHSMTATYEDIDWALDIREATFTTSIDLNCVPGEKALVNNNDQIVIPLAKLRDRYGRVKWGNSAWSLGCKWALEQSPFRAMVVMATGSKNGRADDMAVIEQLRDLAQAGNA